MLILEATQIKKQYGDRIIFEIDRLEIDQHDRIGIVGLNGAGKTTLMNVLAGVEKADEGIVRLFGEHAYITQLEDAPPQDVEKDLAKKLGVADLQQETMSGGEKTRLKIAQSFSRDCHILFADEPTCNLDMAGIQLLEDWFKAFQGALVLISHDRALLDAVCTRILEIENGKVYEYPGNYSAYKQQKEEHLARQHFEYEQYQKEKKRLLATKSAMDQKVASMKKTPTRMGNSEARLHKGGTRDRKGKATKKTKVLESRIERLEVKEKPRKAIQTRIDIQNHQQLLSKAVIRGENLHKAFGSRLLFSGVNFEIPGQSKVALVGNNGSGKTTLLQMIIEGEEKIFLTPSVKLGYFSQNLRELDESKSILDNVLESSIYSPSEVRTILARLLFRRKDVFKPVSVLSGGEKVKTAFAKIFTSDINMIILDEPTNYLDLYSQEALEEVLKEYQGTLLFVSHDRRFVDEIADHILLLENQSIRSFAGNYSEYLQWKEDQKKQSDEKELKMKIMQLENRMHEVLGRLSAPSKKDDVTLLDAEYKKVLGELQELRQQVRC